MSELDAAWDEVLEAPPLGWAVQQPSWHIEDNRWHVFAADDRLGRKRPDYIEAVGMTQAHALRGLAELLGVWRFEGVEERPA